MRGCHGFGTPSDSANQTIPIAGHAEPVLVTAGQHGFGPPALLQRDSKAHRRRPEPVVPAH
jgi:hypothetical protein